MRGSEIFRAVVIAALSLGLTATVHASDIRTERVQFEPGSTGTVIEDRIQGYEIVDYKLGARAGQRMVVDMTTDSTANYFNVMAPGEVDVAFFIGSMSDDGFDGPLPADGDYTIRVYQMRSAARRNETASYSISIQITSPDRTESESAGPVDALVPGTEFHATGNLPCARSAGEPMTSCEFGVVREGEGSGYIKVFWPEGGNRVIFFENGRPSFFDSSEADGGAEMAVDKEADLFLVRIGDQRFEMPELVFVGDNPN